MLIIFVNYFYDILKNALISYAKILVNLRRKIRYTIKKGGR